MTTLILNPELFRGVIFPKNVAAQLVLVPQGPTDLFPEFVPVLVEDGAAEVLPTPGPVTYQLQALWKHRGYWHHPLSIPDVDEVDVLDLVELDEWERAQMLAAAEGRFELGEPGHPGGPVGDPLAAEMVRVGASTVEADDDDA